MVDVRFNAIMVGTNYTNVLGYFDAPQAPLFILRDPPGDRSYSSITNTQQTCYGQTFSVSTDASATVWAKARVGTEGSVGFIVETDYELYGEVGVDLTVGMSATADEEYQTCLETETEFTTGNGDLEEGEDIPGDDVFIGSAIRYAYGMSKTIRRVGCTVQKSAKFEMVPVNVVSSYNYTESEIIGDVIPFLQQQIDLLPVGSTQWRDAQNQLNVWNQTLAMNNAIKAQAPLEVTRAFNGGGNGQTYSTTTTTSQARTIDMSVYLEAGLSAEFGAYLGGSGVSAGGELRSRIEFGMGLSGSNTTTNTMSYHLEDGNGVDNFSVQVRRDPVLGTYAFRLDETVSATSCPYEGGYQIDQPSLSVNTAGQNTMTIENVPIGGVAEFPLILCNNSDQDRTYHLKFSAVSNAEGATLEAFGSTLNSNDDGIEIVLAAGECLSANLSLTQPNAGVIDFENIEVYMYALCEDDIRSSVFLNAYFGTTDPGGFCEPTSSIGPIEGDWVDGVQIGSINNTGTGGPSGAAFVDYTGQSTTLSQNGQYQLAITSGSYVPDRFAAWIDFDQNGAYDASEKLGEVTNTESYQTNVLSFTIPGGAATGLTRMRVRCAFPNGGNDPDPLDACYNYAFGETEDYTIEIVDAPQVDCAGTSGGSALPGTGCDDGNSFTGNDEWNANCLCTGVPLDCTGEPNGSALPGTPCDDGSSNTVSDTYGLDCVCAGTPLDCEGNPGGGALPGTACNDGDPDTGNDVFTADCICAGLLIDCVDEPGGNALPGSSCDDGNPLSMNDSYTAECICLGTLEADCLGILGGTAQPGTACDDGDPGTGNDILGADCLCVGQPFDCYGQPGGNAWPGVPCDDFNPQTIGDVLTENCICLGTFVGNDCEGVQGGPAQPGTPCDDGDAGTGNDVYTAFCQCVGQVIDCFGVIGGQAVPGAFCDDGNPATGADVYGNDCVCAGLLLDCWNIPGGNMLPGTPCDDNNPESENDVYNADCICAGTLANDCLGVPGGTAQPGTACDDGNAGTGNDVWSAACVCEGLLIDCSGTPGGSALPGTPCDDQDACTTDDVFMLDCTCDGTPIAIGAITGPDTVDVGSTNTYYVTPVAGANGYSWNLPAGWSSQNTSDFVIIATAPENAGPAQLCVDAIVDGCVVSSCIDVQALDFSLVPSTTGALVDWFTVRPNPSNGQFQLLPGISGEELRITIHDAIGRRVAEPVVFANDRPMGIDLGDVAAGPYYLLAERGSESRVVKLMVQR